MEVVHSAPEMFSSSARKKNLLPLSQLVEDTRKPANVPHHLLETRVFTKLKSNSVVQAEPSELHFSGFEVGKDYRKTLKLVNISCEVVSVHILPPLTQNFQIKYTKKCRLVPGLAYTVTVNFRPDEWHYFFDNIRIHCKGEENLLVPVHAYPVINDLHIPAHITLPPVPLGQSTSHVIPLKCSCPIDFEFHVHCLQPHEAFTIKPLSGIIPANGKTGIKVTFTPVRYCTADITLQLLISQFNSKPVVWTVTGSSSPYLLTSKKDGNGDVLVKEQSYHGPKKALALSKGVEKKRKDDLQVSNTDIPTRATQRPDKMRYKDLRDNVSNTKPEEQTKKMKEKKVKQKQERASHNRCFRPADMGDNKVRILKAQDCKLNYGGKSVAISKSSPKRSSRQVLRNVKRLEIRSKALKHFKQAVQKVIHQCRENKRLQEDKKTTGQLLKLTPEKLLPFSFPTFLPEDQPDELAVNSLGRVPVRSPIPDMKLSIPIFSPKVPQRYRLMGYQPVSVYDAAATFIPSGLCRALRTGEEDELLACSSTDLSEDEEDWNTEEHEGENQDLYPSPSSCGPEALLNPPNAHPLQICQTEPHIYSVKPALQHPCPTPRHTQKRREMGLYTPPTQKTFQDRKDIKKGIMTQKKFPSMALKTVPSMSTGDQSLHMSDTFSNTLIPMEALPTLQNLPECIKDNIQHGLFNGPELSLTPEMVETEFGVSESSSVTSLKQEEDEGERKSHEQPLESNHSNRSSAEASAIEIQDRTSISTSPCDNK